MTLNEITNQEEFSYAGMDSRIATMLQAKAYRINQITNKSAFEIGKELFEAQQELAKHGYGFFEEWYRSLGFKTTESYQYINHYKFISSESEESKIELFESLPKSLQVEMSKPSALPKVNEAVYSGEITKHKEYKELEKKLKVQEERHQRQLAEKDEVINKTYEQLEKAQNQEPKKVIIEKAPDDYEQMKDRIEHLKRRNEFIEGNYQRMLEERKEVDEKSAKYDVLTESMEEMQGKMTDYQKQLRSLKRMTRLVDDAQEFLYKISPVNYWEDFETLSKYDFDFRELLSLVSSTERWCKDVRNYTDKYQIIEGEIINE